MDEEIHYCDNHDIILRVGDKRFFVEKKKLSEKCQYFEAMFSGNFVEITQDEVFIEVISSESMQYFLNYFYHGMDDIKLLDSVTDIVEASHFLQIPNFESILDNLIPKINLKTWCHILQIAKLNNLSNIKSIATFYGLGNFNIIRKHMKYINDFQILLWYISHVYLKADNELDVFEAACDWLKIHKYEDINSILIILSCLNYQCLSEQSLKIMLENALVRENSLAVNILLSIKLVLQNLKENKLSEMTVDLIKDEICNMFDSNVYGIVCGFLNSPKKRIPPENPCIAGVIDDSLYLLTFNLKNNILTKWLNISDGSLWGYNLVSWNTFNIILICGETNKGRNIWNKDIRLYNCLEKKWSVLNSEPVKPRRHCACLVHNDYIYLIGGVGNFRISLKSVIRYHLKNDIWETLPDLPMHCQLPKATFHNDELYVYSELLYVLRGNAWVALSQLSHGQDIIFSYMNKLHYTLNNHCTLYAIDTEVDNKEELVIKQLNECVFSSCVSGNNLYCWSGNQLNREMENIIICYLDNNDKLAMKTVHLKHHFPNVNFNTTQGGCLCVPNFEIEDIRINNYGERWNI